MQPGGGRDDFGDIRETLAKLGKIHLERLGVLINRNRVKKRIDGNAESPRRGKDLTRCMFALTVFDEGTASQAKWRAA